MQLLILGGGVLNRMCVSQCNDMSNIVHVQYKHYVTVILAYKKTIR